MTYPPPWAFLWARSPGPSRRLGFNPFHDRAAAFARGFIVTIASRKTVVYSSSILAVFIPRHASFPALAGGAFILSGACIALKREAGL